MREEIAEICRVYFVSHIKREENNPFLFHFSGAVWKVDIWIRAVSLTDAFLLSTSSLLFEAFHTFPIDDILEHRDFDAVLLPALFRLIRRGLVEDTSISVCRVLLTIFAAVSAKVGSSVSKEEVRSLECGLRRRDEAAIARLEQLIAERIGALKRQMTGRLHVSV